MKILLGVTGSVATTLAPKLIEALALHELKVVVTDKAKYFLPKDLTVRDDSWEWYSDYHYTKNDPVGHIELRNWADVFVIAPLSANTLGKLANGICDNLLTCVARAWDFKKPIVIAPAMNTLMWEHPITEVQLNLLKSWGYTLVPPQDKVLACGDKGMGAMADISVIVEAIVSKK